MLDERVRQQVRTGVEFGVVHPGERGRLGGPRHLRREQRGPAPYPDPCARHRPHPPPPPPPRPGPGALAPPHPPPRPAGPGSSRSRLSAVSGASSAAWSTAINCPVSEAAAASPTV